MRRYDDVVEVRRAHDVPEHFVWRERLWSVREIVAHWVETGPWWEHAGVDLAGERDVWRVDAARGMQGASSRGGHGVFDLSFDWATGQWRLVGCHD